jgi:hypothetical protein
MRGHVKAHSLRRRGNEIPVEVFFTGGHVKAQLVAHRTGKSTQTSARSAGGCGETRYGEAWKALLNEEVGAPRFLQPISSYVRAAGTLDRQLSATS